MNARQITFGPMSTTLLAVSLACFANLSVAKTTNSLGQAPDPIALDWQKPADLAPKFAPAPVVAPAPAAPKVVEVPNTRTVVFNLSALSGPSIAVLDQNQTRLSTSPFLWSWGDKKAAADYELKFKLSQTLSVALLLGRNNGFSILAEMLQPAALPSDPVAEQILAELSEPIVPQENQPAPQARLALADPGNGGGNAPQSGGGSAGRPSGGTPGGNGNNGGGNGGGGSGGGNPGGNGGNGGSGGGSGSNGGNGGSGGGNPGGGSGGNPGGGSGGSGGSGSPLSGNGTPVVAQIQPPTVVPLPATVLSQLAGLALFGFVARKQSRKSA